VVIIPWREEVVIIPWREEVVIIPWREGAWFGRINWYYVSVLYSQ
jgi:hypothetical protein